ncbi:MAG: signal peptidase I [Ignavibacteria bacterium]|nr:signal peptidase I [Ignavibacteria bacterium]
MILFIILAVIAIIFIILYVIGGWKMFKKAGKPGYAILVPYVDLWIILEIIGRPYWWIFLYMIIAPIIWIIISIDIAKSFGKSIGFGIGIIFLPFIFIPIIGLGKAEYKGSLAQKK